MWQKQVKLARVLAAVLLLGGCAKEYTYAPPASAEGRQCTQQCQLAQGACHDVQTRIAAGAQQQCQAAAVGRVEQCEAATSFRYDQCQQASQQEYTSCLKYATDRSVCKQAACVKEMCTRDSCYQSASYDGCDTQYRGCYQNCGGVVGIMK